VDVIFHHRYRAKPDPETILRLADRLVDDPAMFSQDRQPRLEYDVVLSTLGRDRARYFPAFVFSVGDE
jgi:hypothetical protein